MVEFILVSELNLIGVSKSVSFCLDIHALLLILFRLATKTQINKFSFFYRIYIAL